MFASLSLPFSHGSDLWTGGPPLLDGSPFRTGRCGCVGEAPPCREGLGAVRATDSYSTRGCWLVAHERAIIFHCTPRAPCVNFCTEEKESLHKVDALVRFGDRWNLQNVQGGSVGGYGLLTWFLWISPPPLRSSWFQFSLGFLY
jgi:hypothetical protein